MQEVGLAMNRQTQSQSESAPVSARRATPQAEATRSRWDWVQACVWTVPMLMALENGVKGGKYAYFDALGLFRLEQAHAAAHQSH